MNEDDASKYDSVVSLIKRWYLPDIISTYNAQYSSFWHFTLRSSSASCPLVNYYVC